MRKQEERKEKFPRTQDILQFKHPELFKNVNTLKDRAKKAEGPGIGELRDMRSKHNA